MIRRSFLLVLVACLLGGCGGDPVQDGSDVPSGDVTGDSQPDTAGDVPSDTPADSGDTGDTDTAGDLGDVADDVPQLDATDLGPDQTMTGAALCPTPLPGDWIFCEDFESGNDPDDVFFEYDDNDGEFAVVDTEGVSGSHAMEAVWQQGETSAGRLNVAFGRNPVVYGNRPHVRTAEDFDEIYWRMRVKHQAGWPNVGPAKLNRVTVMAKDDWGQAMIAHLWSSGLVLMGDPASCVSGGTVDCSGYNDFANLDWLGQMPGAFELFSSASSGTWHCVEGHVRLNTPGQSDGVFEFWIDGQVQSSRSDLDWRGSYTGHGINLASFENYWNDGATADLRRWFDDIAIATVPIGCN